MLLDMLSPLSKISLIHAIFILNLLFTSLVDLITDQITYLQDINRNGLLVIIIQQLI